VENALTALYAEAVEAARSGDAARAQVLRDKAALISELLDAGEDPDGS
jgi:dihydrodipicolinate synthase/N-acetylneuraminate lyase